MNLARSNWLKRLDRIVIGFLWGTDGLERGLSLTRLTRQGILLFVGVVVLLLAQSYVLPDYVPNSWPRKSLKAINIVALIAGIYVSRRRAHFAKWAALAAAGSGTVVVYAVIWTGGFVPQLTPQAAIDVASQAVAAAGANVEELVQPTAYLLGRHRDTFEWHVEFDSVRGNEGFLVKLLESSRTTEIVSLRILERRVAGDRK